MMRDRQDGRIAYLHFPHIASARRQATIAAAPSAAPGWTRAIRAASRIDNGRLIGESPAMIEVVRQLQRYARSRVPVMLVGDRGTGKGLAARLLHENSPRSRSPFVAADCSALPAPLVEAVLFGCELGARGPGVRRGRLERAYGGTLFLDDIDALPLDLQRRLLHVLDSGRMVRCGGAEEIAVDVRVVSASRLPPGRLVRDGLLRKDLLYRLAAVTVRMPALRQRGDDIQLLARAFLERLNNEHGTGKRFAAGALARARSHAWPGNVRELRDCVERGYLLSEDAVTLDPRSDGPDPAGDGGRWPGARRPFPGRTPAEAGHAGTPSGNRTARTLDAREH